MTLIKCNYVYDQLSCGCILMQQSTMPWPINVELSRSQFAAILKAGIVDNPHVSHGCFFSKSETWSWQSPPSDGQTKGRTDRRTNRPSLACRVWKFVGCKKYSIKSQRNMEVVFRWTTWNRHLITYPLMLLFWIFSHTDRCIWAQMGSRKNNRFYHSLRLKKHLITY